VEAALGGLGFERTVFQVAVEQRVAGPMEPALRVDGRRVGFDATGLDNVAFVIAPNPGEPARPLARIASGGELSRVALAIKQILADADRTPTLVFDEIDTGIGGRSAEPVGRSLWELARTHQVLCVTHLGQIAAYADAQFRIEKVQRDGRTVTVVRRIEGLERAQELAEMLAGAEGGSAALASAEELLGRADAWKRSIGES
jgi:DNA repair protein RecN (Recombination protein N)